ncbi:MAG TPA: hypothetical protein VIK61_02225 [Acidimicrobiia bacterium]
MDTVRRELLDRTLICNHRQLERRLDDDIVHNNQHRPHCTLGQRAPNTAEVDAFRNGRPIRRHQTVAGSSTRNRQPPRTTTDNRHTHHCNPNLRHAGGQHHAPHRAPSTANRRPDEYSTPTRSDTQDRREQRRRIRDPRTFILETFGVASPRRGAAA